MARAEKKAADAPPPPEEGNVRRLEYVPLTELKAAKRNPKGHSDDIGGSIERFGYVEPIVLDERTGRLVAGHGRLQALRVRQQKGEPPPEGVREKGTQWLVPVLRGWGSRSDTEAEAYLLASNQLTIAGGWEVDGLTDMLKDLSGAHGLDAVGFSEDELKRLLAGATGSADPPAEPPFDPSLKFQIVVECANEGVQAALLERFEREGLKCRPLML